jgi:hypothetical protein
MNLLNLTLPNSAAPQPLHKFRECAKCLESRPPEGGVEMRPGRWLCSKCWAAKAAGKNGGLK